MDKKVYEEIQQAINTELYLRNENKIADIAKNLLNKLWITDAQIKNNEDKLIIIKKEEAEKYLSVSLQEKLTNILECIEFGRYLDSKQQKNERLRDTMIETLKQIVNYNFSQLEKVDFDQNHAQNLFTIDHNGTSIYNFFTDETGRVEVNPLDYYDYQSLVKVVNSYISFCG
jgi:hypothetical protein